MVERVRCFPHYEQLSFAVAFRSCFCRTDIFVVLGLVNMYPFNSVYVQLCFRFVRTTRHTRQLSHFLLQCLRKPG